MYNQPMEERVKTPLPEKLKNSFSFANHNQEEDHMNEEELQQVMENGNYMERHNLDLFNQQVEEEDQFVVQDVVPKNIMPPYNRNKLRNEMMENLDEEPEDIGALEESKPKKKRKKRKPQKNEEIKETDEINDSNLVPFHQIKTDATTRTQLKEASTNIIENDLFADMTKTHYLSISPNDIIVAKENEELEETIDDEPKNLMVGPLSLRQKTIFIENPVSGQFRKVKENDFNHSKHEGEEIIEDEQAIIQKEISSYNSTVLITNNNLFVLLLFVQGILVGFCTLHVLINIPLYTSLTDYVEWYSPISTILQKIYMVFTCVCSVLSIYILSIELKPPLQKGTLFTELLIFQSPAQHKARLISSFIVRTLLIVGSASYTISFLCSVVIGFADEYFAFHYFSSGKKWTSTLTSTDLEKVTRNAIGWHTINGMRTLCSIVGWISVVILFRTLRRQSETSFQQLLKEQSIQ